MYELMVCTRFAAAHSLRDYEGPCARLHGHTWQVDVTVKGRQLDPRGMLVDFKEIKAAVRNVVEKLDHQNLNDLEAFQQGGTGNPTAENLSRFIYSSLASKMVDQGRNVIIASVRVWESPDACAVYREVD